MQVVVCGIFGFLGSAIAINFFRGYNVTGSGTSISYSALSSLFLALIPLSFKPFECAFPTHLSDLDASSLKFFFTLLGAFASYNFLYSNDALSFAPVLLMPLSLYLVHLNATNAGKTYRRPIYCALANLLLTTFVFICFGFLFFTTSYIAKENAAFLANAFQFFMLFIFVVFKFLATKASTPHHAPILMVRRSREQRDEI